MMSQPPPPHFTAPLPRKTPERRKRSRRRFSVPPTVRLCWGVSPGHPLSTPVTLCISVPSSCHRLRPRETLGPPLSLPPRLAIGNGWEGVSPRHRASNLPPIPLCHGQDTFAQTAPLALPGKATELPAGLQNPAGRPRLCRSRTHCCWILSPISCESPVRAFPHPSEAQSLLGPFKDVPLPSTAPSAPPPP